jgi:ABC-2 type transport system permease protein
MTTRSSRHKSGTSSLILFPVFENFSLHKLRFSLVTAHTSIASQEFAMSTATLPLAPHSPPSAIRICLREIRYEVLRSLRTRAFSLSAIGFPVMFYALFGLVMNRDVTIGGVNLAKYMLGGYAVFGSLGAAIFGIGVAMALDRSAGWLELKRASPMPPLAYLLAKCFMAALYSVIIVMILTALGIAFGHVHMSVLEFAKIAGIAAAAAVPFSAMGLAMAVLVPPASAGGIANMIYLPMSFLSGLWIPLKLMPHALQEFAPVLPTYHLAQLMYHALGAPSYGHLLTHWLVLAGFTVLMLMVASAAFRRQELNA